MESRIPPRHRAYTINMIILGIETSCDETGAAVVKDGKHLLSNVVASSQSLHAKTGGIIPEIAARQQLSSINPVINEALSVAKVTKEDVDALAVTVGPGLIGSLLVGVETAKTLSVLWQKPIIPVNHLLGHIYANFIKRKLPTFPAIALVVSGGHTDMVYMKDHPRRAKVKWLGGTRDDAAGEAFDKTARLLNLPYPGGPKLAELADKFIKKHPQIKLNLFPRPLLSTADFDFSFSGLKTSVKNYLEKNKDIDKGFIAAQVQAAIVDVIVAKAVLAREKYRTSSFMLAGGVAANYRLRKKLGESMPNMGKFGSLHIPADNLCTDNAAYIAAFAFYNYKPHPWRRIYAKPNLTIIEL